MKGKIITIEGSDGSGKETQKFLLLDKLDKDYKIKTRSFPDYPSFFGKTVDQYLNGEFGSLNDIHPKLSSLPYSLDRLQHKNEIIHWLKTGGNWIFDRYMESNWAHQASRLEGKGRNELIDWLEEAETKHLGLPSSDLIIYLDLPIEFNQRAIEKQGRKKDIHESNLDYQLKVYEAYKNLTSTKDNWHLVDCLKPNYEELPEEEQRLTKKEVHEKLLEIILPNIEKSELNFYFATSMTRTNADSEINKHIVNLLERKGNVLSKHIVREDVHEYEAKQIKDGVNIYDRDMGYVENSNYMVIEASGGSFGVGREIERATMVEIPILALYEQGLDMSRMLSHDPRVTMESYKQKEELEGIINKFIQNN